jgi:hypothetical protein
MVSDRTEILFPFPLHRKEFTEGNRYPGHSGGDQKGKVDPLEIGHPTEDQRR